MEPSETREITARVGWFLRRLADRIDPTHAPRCIGHTFTFERNRGLVFHSDTDWPRVGGCPIWYLSDDDYAKAHTEAVDPL